LIPLVNADGLVLSMRSVRVRPQCASTQMRFDLYPWQNVIAAFVERGHAIADTQLGFSVRLRRNLRVTGPFDPLKSTMAESGASLA